MTQTIMLNGVLFLIWLEGMAVERAIGRDGRKTCIQLLPKRRQPFLTSLSLSSLMRQLNKHQFLFPLCVSLPFRVFPFPCAIQASPHCPYCLLILIFFQLLLSPHPPFTCESRQGFNFSILIVSLPTLCMSNTYWHSRDRQYTPSNAYYTPTCFWCVCVQGVMRV